jgi:hypothetical protein
MDERRLFRNFRVMITQPGKNTAPFGLIEADTEAEAWLWTKQLIREKGMEESIDPDSRVELVDPEGRWLEPSSTVRELLSEQPEVFFAQ